MMLSKAGDHGTILSPTDGERNPDRASRNEHARGNMEPDSEELPEDIPRKEGQELPGYSHLSPNTIRECTRGV